MPSMTVLAHDLELQMRTLHQALARLQRELSQGDVSGHSPRVSR
jgi:hypothetical protein